MIYRDEAQRIKESTVLDVSQKAGQLRELVSRVERHILNVTGPDPMGDWRHEWTRDRYDMVDGDFCLVNDLLSDRKYILNLLFALHRSDAEVNRFSHMNEHLYRLTKELKCKVADTYRLLLDSQVGDTFTDDINIDGVIHYGCESAQDYVELADDAFYGSDFPKMLAVISAAENASGGAIIDIGCRWNPDIHNSGMTDDALGVVDALDDGESWDEPPLDLLASEEICICYALHDICCHKGFSIPDLLRLNCFWTEVKLDIQNIRETDGSVLWWWDKCTCEDFIAKFMREAEARPEGTDLKRWLVRRVLAYFDESDSRDIDTSGSPEEFLRRMYDKERQHK